MRLISILFTLYRKGDETLHSIYSTVIILVLFFKAVKIYLFEDAWHE